VPFQITNKSVHETVRMSLEMRVARSVWRLGRPEATTSTKANAAEYPKPRPIVEPCPSHIHGHSHGKHPPPHHCSNKMDNCIANDSAVRVSPHRSPEPASLARTEPGPPHCAQAGLGGLQESSDAAADRVPMEGSCVAEGMVFGVSGSAWPDALRCNSSRAG